MIRNPQAPATDFPTRFSDCTTRFGTTCSLLVATMVLLLGAGCTESLPDLLGTVAEANPIAEDIPTEIQSSESSPLSTIPAAIQNVAEETIAALPAVDQVQQRIGKLFQRVLPTLDKTRTLIDRHAKLPEKSRLPFRTDQQSNADQIDKLLDNAIEMLGMSEVSDYRQQIRDTNSSIRESHTTIADYRRQKVSAPWKKDQGRLEKVNPFAMSQEALDEAISEELAKIEANEANIVALKQSFANELTKIGLEVDEAGVESLLTSVSGDDIVSMAIVFDNIKHLTTQLQQLTEDSGEALETSKRYYGIYVVMIQVMDRIQRTFIRDINEEHIPQLHAFTAQAEQNIQQAESLIQSRGGDEETLRANIDSNELTRKTARLYVDYLEQNAALIDIENRKAQRNLATAMNTYETVKLSSDVAALMNTGRKNFETLMRLQVPALREFGNDAIRREFQRMTTELRSNR